MNISTMGIIGMVVLVLLAILVQIKLFRMYNGPDGERIRRRQAQGPFVPLSAEDIAEDRERKVQ